MNASASPGSAAPPRARRRLFQVGAVGVLLVLLYVVLRPSKTDGGASEHYLVKRGDFTVSVIEPGTLTAISEVVIRSEVEGTARIISIVPEGALVKKGDLLVELDSSQAQDQVNQQLISVEKARFAVTNAEAQLEIQRSATNVDYLAAKLKLDLAIIDRDKYEQGQRLVDLLEAQNKALQASNQLVVNRETYSNSVRLAEKGYETKQKVDGDRLSVLATENQLIAATNVLWMLDEFDVEKQIKKFNSDVQQAEEQLQQQINLNKRKMAQYEADLLSQINTLKLNEDKLERDRKNLEATRIDAPQDGLVVYQVSENRFSSESLVEGGAVVRNRQELIKLPDLSRMKVVVKIHESHINMIRAGLPAFVVLDSDPDKRYGGVVAKVAPLPDTQARWGNPNLKVYNTEVYLSENPPNVKPGVSAKAEIVITNIADVLSVPIQAVTTFKGKQVAYVLNRGKPEPRPVEVGMFTTKFIQGVQGREAGDRVMLSPPFDSHEKDLEGAVLADEEKAKITFTNVPPIEAAPPNGLGHQADSQGGANGRPGLTAAGTEGGGRGPTPGAGAGTGPFGGVNPEEILKQYDKNGDGTLDETERESMRAAFAARFGGQGPPGEGPGGGMRPGREEMLKRFDKDGDGQLDEGERAAMREAMGSLRPNRGERRGEGEAGARPNRDAAPSPQQP